MGVHAIVEYNKNVVLEGTLMGLKQEEIAKKIGKSVRTISRYLRSKKEEFEKDINKEKSKMLVGMLNAHMSMRVRKAWLILSGETSSDRDKLTAIRELREEDKELVHRMQIIGLLPKDTAIIDTQQNNTQVNIKNEMNVSARTFKEAYAKYFGKGSSEEKERQSPE